VAITKPEYTALLGKEDLYTKLTYICVEGELISKQSSDGLGQKLRHLPEPNRIRLIVDVLEESIKTNADAGLQVNEVKSNSKIVADKGLYEMIWMSLVKMGTYLKEVKTKDDRLISSMSFTNVDVIGKMKNEIAMDKKSTERSVKRKREAIKFEGAVADYLKENLTDIEWEEGDAKIMTNHDLSGQGIDILGKCDNGSNTVWIPIQCKDRENAIPPEEIDTFITTVRQLKEVKLALNKNDVFLPLLVLAKAKSFKYDMYYKLITKNIITVVDDGKAIGEKTVELINTRDESGL
jgi:hypothetical protein